VANATKCIERQAGYCWSSETLLCHLCLQER